jgi:hypothetical protein
MGTFAFGHGLNLERAEKALLDIASLSTEADEISLDLASCMHVDVGAGWRLGNALRDLATRGRLRITVPELVTFDDQRWFLHFTRSGLGMAIAQYAAEVNTPSRDITAEIKDYYSAPRSYVGSSIPAWVASTFMTVPNLHRGVLPVESEDEARFRSVLRELLPNAHLDLEAFTGPASDSLMQLLFEAVQNVWDHADQAPLPSGTQISSYLAIRYYRDIALPKTLTQEFRSYLERLPVRLPEQADFVGYIEVVVGDDGVGIAARHAQNGGIYKGSLEVEVASLINALQDGASVKRRVRDATIRGVPGYGITKITADLRTMTAFAMLRTGRTLAFFDSTLPESGFIMQDAPLGYLPGTVLQIVFPRRIERVWDTK